MGKFIKNSNVGKINPTSQIDSKFPPAKPLKNQESTPEVGILDPQVKTTKPYRARRKLTPAYKMRMLAAYDACDSSERGSFLRREGLYYANISLWRRQMSGQWKGKKRHNNSNNNLSAGHLRQENERLKKKLAQAEAVIELQKKVSELLGQHILSPESNEVNS